MTQASPATIHALHPDADVRDKEKKAMTYQLLQKGDLAPYRVENADADNTCVIICDHAGTGFPIALDMLGTTEKQRQMHITSDIGTEDIGMYLSKKMNAMTLIAQYSRLVADVNRSPDREDCMPAISDGEHIPGNQNISAEERQARIDEIHTPYQHAVGQGLQSFIDRGVTPFCLSVHSFTPSMDDFQRPWEIGILWTEKDKLAVPMIETLRRNNPDLHIGDNEPYSLQIGGGRDFSNTVELQATARGVPSLIVEFRQDTVDTKAKAHKMADIFYESLIEVLRETDFYREAV